MNKITGNEVLLTSEDVRGWQAELKKWEAVKIEADAQIAELRKKLDAVALISGSRLAFGATGEATAVEGQETMGDAVKRILATWRKPVFHHELQTALKQFDVYRASLERNPAYYYTLIGRLVKRGDVKKVGKKRIRFAQKNEALSEGNPENASETVEGSES